MKTILNRKCTQPRVEETQYYPFGLRMVGIIIFFTILFIAITLVIAFLFFRDPFLFFINGNYIHLAKTTTAESFEAYKQIYTSKVVIVIFETLLSLITLLISRKLLSSKKYFVYKLSFWVSLVIAIVFLVQCFGFILLP